jgi:hypothetical protein
MSVIYIATECKKESFFKLLADIHLAKKFFAFMESVGLKIWFT